MLILFVVLTCSVILIIGYVCYVIYTEYYLKNKKLVEKKCTNKILFELRNKKKPSKKITLIEKLNVKPQYFNTIISSMLKEGFIRYDDIEVTITKFGKLYYDKIIKKS